MSKGTGFATGWHDDPPPTPGTYPWRRSWQWEDIEREVRGDRMIFSERYCKEVPVEHIGGQWYYTRAAGFAAQ